MLASFSSWIQWPTAIRYRSTTASTISFTGVYLALPDVTPASITHLAWLLTIGPSGTSINLFYIFILIIIFLPWFCHADGREECCGWQFHFQLRLDFLSSRNWNMQMCPVIDVNSIDGFPIRSGQKLMNCESRKEPPNLRRICAENLPKNLIRARRTFRAKHGNCLFCLPYATSGAEGGRVWSRICILKLRTWASAHPGGGMSGVPGAGCRGPGGTGLLESGRQRC